MSFSRLGIGICGIAALAVAGGIGLAVRRDPPAVRGATRDVSPTANAPQVVPAPRELPSTPAVKGCSGREATGGRAVRQRMAAARDRLRAVQGMPAPPAESDSEAAEFAATGEGIAAEAGFANESETFGDPVAVPWDSVDRSVPAIVPAALARAEERGDADEAVGAEVDAVRDAFLEAAGEGDADDPEFSRRWEAAAMAADELLRMRLGDDVWRAHHIQVHREALSNAAPSQPDRRSRQDAGESPDPAADAPIR